MNLSRFFIDRPIFAWVLSIVVMLAGLMAIRTLPLEQYPDIAPPRVSINATYTGASAKTVEDSVTQVIEQQMKGLDNLLYMQSTSNSSGVARLSLTFNAGTNIDVAQMQVQNKLQQAMSRLPQQVQSRGVTVTKGGNDFLMIVSMYSGDGSASAVDVGDYISSNLVDVISRIDGVGEVQTLGTGYAMRLWLDPDKLRKYALMPLDVGNAITAQNAQVSAGQLGALPAGAQQQLNATITARSKLQTVEQFREVIVKSAPDGSVVRLGDVARVEPGARPDLSCRDLGVLGLDRSADVRRHQRMLVHARRIHPQAHRVPRAADGDVADPVDAADHIDQAALHVVTDLDVRQAAVLGIQRHQQQQVGAGLGDRDPLGLHRLRQLRH
eukprot:gene18062-25334_t